MRKIISVSLIILFVTAFAIAQASVQDIIITPTQPSSLIVKIWTDRAIGSTYYQGDNIHIYFKTSQDAYITIYDYTTDGNLRVLFPNSYQRDNFVKGGEVYVIPNPNYGYNLIVSGPNGRETIEAVASIMPGVIPQPKMGNQAFTEIPEGLGYLQKLKVDIVGKPVAVATTYFYVGYVPGVGIVHFDSNPNGASLYVDGVYEGKTPLDLQLPEGNHLAVFWYGIFNISKAFSVIANTYQNVSSVIPAFVTQPQQSFSINFTTSPSGAMIFVNGKMLGISPCSIDLGTGNYEITVVKPDYSTVVTNVYINGSQNFNFSLQRLR